MLAASPCSFAVLPVTSVCYFSYRLWESCTSYMRGYFPLRLQHSSKQLWNDSPITSSPQGRWTSSQEPRRICFQRRARTSSPDFLNHFLPLKRGRAAGRGAAESCLAGRCLRGVGSGQTSPRRAARDSLQTALQEAWPAPRGESQARSGLAYRSGPDPAATELPSHTHTPSRSVPCSVSVVRCWA